MDGFAARRVTVSPRTFQKGQAVSFPDDQFATFEELGLVQRTPVDGIDPRQFEVVESDLEPVTGAGADQSQAARAANLEGQAEADAALKSEVDDLEAVSPAKPAAGKSGK